MHRTYIFTFDSLGGKHPAAANNLSRYLQMEAKDKKGLDISQTTPAAGVTALVRCFYLAFTLMECQYLALQVPAQPNFCDCGVYLIHFVQTFMSYPDSYIKKIVVCYVHASPIRYVTTNINSVVSRRRQRPRITTPRSARTTGKHIPYQICAILSVPGRCRSRKSGRRRRLRGRS